MQDQIFASHSVTYVLMGHMDVDCSASLQTLNVFE